MSALARLLAIPALTASVALGAGVAGAATVLDVGDTYPAGATSHGTLTCSETCLGLVATGPSTWADDGAVLFTVSPPNDANELAWVNAVTGSTFASGDKTEDGGDAYSFLTDALYILFKIGGGHSNATFLVENTYGAGLELSWASLPGMGAGLSHYVEYGTAPPPAIPLPAGGFLLLGGLGMLAALRRRAA